MPGAAAGARTFEPEYRWDREPARQAPRKMRSRPTTTSPSRIAPGSIVLAGDFSRGRWC